MHVHHSLLLYRLGLVAVLLLPSLNCMRGDEVPEACGCAGACAVPPEAEAEGDDDAEAPTPEVPETDLTALLSVCRGGVLASVSPEGLQAPGPGSEGYGYEPEDRLAALEQSFEDLLDGYPAAAVTQAFLVDYELCRGEDDETGLAVWRPVDATGGGARVVFRSLGAAPWIVEAPHAGSVPASAEAAAAIFDANAARVLVVGGTHRCASSVPTACDAPSACDDGPAAISDMAAWTESVFHVAHTVFSSRFDDAVLGLTGLDGDGISLSDGTLSDAEAAPTEHASMRIAEALRGWDAHVTACRAGLDLPVDERACGTFNVQGRLTNAPDADPCGDTAAEASGRWVHLAVAADLLGPDTPLAEVLR